MKGKYLSILGDSISTYQGVSNDESANKSIGENPVFYHKPFPLDSMYFMRFMREFGLSLCVNNSYSGGNLSGRDNENSGVNRANRLARDDGLMPDIIVLFMGINDLGRGVSEEVFASDYRETLEILKKYPATKILCVNLPDRDIFLRERAEIFNKIIEDAVDEAGERFYLVDLYRSRLCGDFYYMNTLDGLHPDEDGMRIIAEVIIDTSKRILE